MITKIFFIAAFPLLAVIVRDSRNAMTVEKDPKTGQYIICDAGKAVLQYNYQTVSEQDVVRSPSQSGKKITYSPIDGGVYLEEYYKSNPAERGKPKTSQIYGQPRSDYIHPLYGLNGEIMTNDWPDGGHPHHRGIFWAWPEVEWNGERADMYALQRAFARPTGNVKCSNGKKYAEIRAENNWLWEERTIIVKELATIRAYKANKDARIIDLTIRLTAVVDSVTIATRFTNSYGGFNIKMAAPANQVIATHIDPATSSPLRTWLDFSGTFEGQKLPSGMTILQNAQNPEYPGEWIAYASLQQIQPVFPTNNTRYSLEKGKPLTLRFRLIIHNGDKPTDEILKNEWDIYNK